MTPAPYSDGSMSSILGCGVRPYVGSQGDFLRVAAEFRDREQCWRIMYEDPSFQCNMFKHGYGKYSMILMTSFFVVHFYDFCETSLEISQIHDRGPKKLWEPLLYVKKRVHSQTTRVRASSAVKRANVCRRRGGVTARPIVRMGPTNSTVLTVRWFQGTYRQNWVKRMSGVPSGNVQKQFLQHLRNAYYDQYILRFFAEHNRNDNTVFDCCVLKLWINIRKVTLGFISLKCELILMILLNS